MTKMTRTEIIQLEGFLVSGYIGQRIVLAANAKEAKHKYRWRVAELNDPGYCSGITEEDTRQMQVIKSCKKLEVLDGEYRRGQ